MNLNELAWIRTPKYLNVIYEGKNISIERSSARCKTVEALIKKGGQKEKIIEELFLEKKVVKYSKGKFGVKENDFVDLKTQQPLPKVISSKLTDFIKDGLPGSAIANFWENVKMNPNPSSVNQLFEYLNRNHFVITSDGSFLAYKYVNKTDNGKLVDDRTKTFDNSVGKIVTMDRKKCDTDRTVTCSSGLHVATFSYASECGGGHVLVEVKVNPKDVVSVPNDYNDRKMRVCRYEVLRVVTKQNEATYAKVKNEKVTPDRISTTDVIPFQLKTAQQIIDIVKEQTGKVITTSLKNKKSIIRKAIKIFDEQGLKYK